MGLFNRDRPGASLSAAATLVEPGDDVERTRIRQGPQPWQVDSWNSFDDVVEISYGMGWQSNCLSRLRLVPAVRPDPRADPIPLDPDGDDDLTDITDEERAACFATLDRLGSGPQSIGELQRLTSLNLAVAGEGYLVGYEGDDGEVWDVLSVQELIPSPTGRGYARRSLGQLGIQGVEELPEDAFIARTFIRHPRFSGWAHSSMRACLPLVDELRDLTDAIRATASSRIPAGILMLPHGFRGGVPTDQTLTGQPDEAANDQNVANMSKHLEAPIKNRKSASRVTPFVWFANKDDVTAAKVIEFQRHIDQWMATTRQELILRLGTGLDMPPEVLTGIGKVKYWNAQMIDESAFKDHLEPDAQALVEAWTSGYYRPHLLEMGIEAAHRFFIWYDPTNLVAHPNKEQDYLNLYDRIEVSGEALRRVHVVPETDAPDDEERGRRLYEEVFKRLRAALQALPTPDQIIGQEHNVNDSIPIGDIPNQQLPPTPTGAPTPPPPTKQDAAPTTPPSPGPTTPPPAARAAVQVPPLGSLAASAAIGPVGPRLARLEQTLRLRLTQKADDELTRVLEKAGNRLRQLASRHGGLKGLVAEVSDPLEIGQALGPDGVAQLTTSTDDLLAGKFDQLHPQWNTWVSRTQEQALAAIDDHGDLTDEQIAEIRSSMGDSRDNGWAVLLAGLTALAAQKLYAPHEPPPERGEFSDFSVPTGLISDALREAGGGTSDSGSSGLLSGATMIDTINQAGLQVTSYTWIHGDPIRDYVAHANLDGVPFSSWDDPALATDGAEDYDGWPDVEFFSPNNGPDGADHDTCTCSAELTIENADTSDESLATDESSGTLNDGGTP